VVLVGLVAGLLVARAQIGTLLSPAAAPTATKTPVSGTKLPNPALARWAPSRLLWLPSRRAAVCLGSRSRAPVNRVLDRSFWPRLAHSREPCSSYANSPAHAPQSALHTRGAVRARTSVSPARDTQPRARGTPIRGVARSVRALRRRRRSRCAPPAGGRGRPGSAPQSAGLRHWRSWGTPSPPESSALRPAA